ncbi:hypothetical protein [Flavisolibacter ginsenosidimutans]|uniref:hypothetical protein n=1 Tax=Flavisolibacter ginsenosidimutans TaxID=661481 RepID=UPI00155A705F|nr:hypothetical protein [Flavisolibacter ginsenosidimutans]
MKDKENREQRPETATEKTGAGMKDISDDRKADTERSEKDDTDTSDYVVIESGLGIDE